MSCRTRVFVVTSVARTFARGLKCLRCSQNEGPRGKYELASFRVSSEAFAMAGSWGGHSTTPEELWSSLFTVVHASWDDLRPLLERFDLDDLVAFRRGLQSAIEDQVERQFVEAEEAAAQESSAAAAGPSGDRPGVASGSGSADPQVASGGGSVEPQVAPAAQDRLGAPAAKEPTTGPPPTMGTPKVMSVQAKAFVKADPPPFIPPISKTKGKGKGKDSGPPVATPKPKASPPPGKQVAVKATPDQVRALFAGEMQPQTAEDAIGFLRATDAATRPQAHQVAVVDLDTMDDDLDDDPPLPPPPGLPPSSPSPPSKPMPSAPKKQVDQPPKASFPPVAKEKAAAVQGAPPDDGSQQQEGTQAAASSSSSAATGSRSRSSRSGPRPAVNFPDLQAALAYGPPGPIMATQFAPVGLPAPWPNADVDTGVVFRDEPPPYTDVTSICAVRCPSCWLRACPRVNRPGYRKPHEHHMCSQCHENAKRLDSRRT